jgi:hypothetical protein
MTDEPKEKMISLLQEIARWTKFQGFLKLKELLTTVIHTDSEKLIYEYSDGRSTAEVAKLVGVSNVTVYNYWTKWSKLGIMEPSMKYKGRLERMISLQDIGMTIPPAKIAMPKNDTPDVVTEDTKGDSS